MYKGIVFLIATIFVQACGSKEETTALTSKTVNYPELFINYKNILSGKDTVYVSIDSMYGFYAVSDEDIQLKITLTNLSDTLFEKLPSWFFSQNNGWLIPDIDNKIQIVYSITNNPAALIEFPLGPGKMNIKCQENEETTINKTLIWQ